MHIKHGFKLKMQVKIGFYEVRKNVFSPVFFKQFLMYYMWVINEICFL